MAKNSKHQKTETEWIRAALIACCLTAFALGGPAAAAAEGGPGWQEAADWGGHFRLRGTVSDPQSGSRLDILGRDRLHDAAFEFRSKYSLRVRKGWRFALHYEMIGTAGETRQAETAFLHQYPFAERFAARSGTSNERRLMDLTHEVAGHTDYRVVHRIDRLAVSVHREWGSLRIGRQALTWGNGFLFSPMDLFNPFSPTDVERDYKTGDDMLTVQAYTGAAGEIELLYVPRRDQAARDIKWKQSSTAAKWHTYAGSLEMDVMAGAHYDDAVFGLGLTGYLGSAAWRLDATYTVLDNAAEHGDYASICANMDYSWVWWGKNMYGWIEYYYTGLGTSDYENVWADPEITPRLERGERFTLGRSYLDAKLRVEIHPLLNAHFTMITNLRDPSGVIQPRLVWEVRQNFQLTAGANFYYGGPDSEFGGFSLPGTALDEAPADNIYLWASLFY